MKHASDCSTNNEPAYPKGACDCIAPVLSWIDNQLTWLVEPYGFNVNNMSIFIKEEKDARLCFDLLIELRKLKEENAVNIEKIKNAKSRLCDFTSNPENYDLNSQELIEVQDAIELLDEALHTND